MMLAEAYLETPARRLVRWSSSAGMMLAVHLAAGTLAYFYWPELAPREEQQPGAITVELLSLAAESPSDQQDLAEQPVFDTSAPAPSPVDDVEELPAEDVPPLQPEPVADIPAKLAEAAAVADSPAEPLEAAPVEEAPLAPEPVVTLPQELPRKPEETAEEPAKKPAEQPAQPAKPQPTKRAQKSESRQQREAAASAWGRFDPNPIYRAKPAYPSAARANKIEGYVVVSYSVSASGTVSNVRVVSSSPPGIFNAVTVSAVSQWRFKPSAQGAHGRRTTVRFKLR